mgnify:CR=1 FL=1
MLFWDKILIWYKEKQPILFSFIKNHKRFFTIIFSTIIALLIFGGAFYITEISPPRPFPKGTVVSIKNGATLLDVAQELKNKGIIRSPFWFRIFLMGLKDDKGAIAGDYLFLQSINVISVANRVYSGEYGFNTIKITIPEGLSVSDISIILKGKLFNFDAEFFIKMAKEKEGYLFPETYFFRANEKPEDILFAMTNLFDKKIKTLDAEIKDFKKPISDVIKMASILEGEARTAETRKIVAGILWKRIALGMPLQVDTAFQYINGKNSSNLTIDDLKIESPYNLYINKGLPPTPISNPGLEAILDTVTPRKSNYLYFLTDKNGVMHYAVTFEGHKINKEKYLK